MAAAITTTATTLEAQLVEIAKEIEVREKAAIAADTAGTFSPRLTILTDAEAGEISISVTLAANVTGTGGTVSFVPQTYLA